MPRRPLEHDQRLLRENETWKTHFGTEIQCRTFVFRMTFPHGLACPRCHLTKFRLDRLHAVCTFCRRRVSFVRGTIFEGTGKDLSLWFQAAFYLMAIDDMSARRLSQLLGVTYKTAWAWCHKLRHVLSTLVVAGLRPKPRPPSRRGLLQAADFADPLTTQERRWANFVLERGGPRPEEPLAARLARLDFARRTSGHLSDRHLPRYLDLFTVSLLSRTGTDAFLILASLLPRTAPLRYRDLVPREPPRPWLVLAPAWRPRARPLLREM